MKVPQIKKRLMLVAVMSFGCLGAKAQAVVGPEAANVYTVCLTEGCTVTSISSPTAVLQFGAGSTWATLNAPALPLKADCNGGCPAQIGDDPATNVPKSLVAIEQAQSYTVTLGDGTVVNVPAIAATPPPVGPADCSLPVSSSYPAVTPASPANCTLMAGAVAIATDGQMVAMQQAFAPYYIQYCQGAVCNAPQVGAISWLLVGPDTLGGPTGGTGTGTLYMVAAIPGYKLLVGNAPKALSIPALVTIGP